MAILTDYKQAEYGYIAHHLDKEIVKSVIIPNVSYLISPICTYRTHTYKRLVLPVSCNVHLEDTLIHFSYGQFHLIYM